MIISVYVPCVAQAIMDNRYRRRFLAEGDSWFSIGGWTTNLLEGLVDSSTLIVNCASPGDTIRNVANMGGGTFAWMLRKTDSVPPWDGVLLSAGGNDLLCRCAGIITPDPDNPIDWHALDRRLDEIEDNLRRILDLVASLSPGTPSYIGTYDYPPVSRKWAWWHIGPWVAPVLEAARIPRDKWDGIVVEMIDALANRLKEIAAYRAGLVVVDTRMTLRPNQWRNEIHPTRDGYRTLAAKWEQKLQPENCANVCPDQ